MADEVCCHSLYTFIAGKIIVTNSFDSLIALIIMEVTNFVAYSQSVPITSECPKLNYYVKLNTCYNVVENN